MTATRDLSDRLSPQLPPALPMTRPPQFPGATWIGLIDDPPRRAVVKLDAATGFAKARLLIRCGGKTLGFAEVPVTDGTISTEDLWSQAPTPHPALALQPRTDRRPPAITVAICTRNRAESLACALDSVLRQDYPDFEIVIVDNAANSQVSEEHVASLGQHRIRVVHEPRPGLSRARNAAVLAARHPVIAFTDDDVVVDSQWLHAIGEAFLDYPDAACVTGLVPTGELTLAAHAYFDRRVGWAKNLHPRCYSLTDPPLDSPLFPFRIGLFGTGANFAITREAVIALGGFDEILGAGSPTKGGEDLDMFFRVITSGRALAYEPSAIVWHRHRDDVAGLVDQSRGYGMGLGAWLTADVLLSPRSWRLAAGAIHRNLGTAVRLAFAMRESATPDVDLVDSSIPVNIGRVEMTAILSGPWAYLRGWREGRVARPLAHQDAR